MEAREDTEKERDRDFCKSGSGRLMLMMFSEKTHFFFVMGSVMKRKNTVQSSHGQEERNHIEK